MDSTIWIIQQYPAKMRYSYYFGRLIQSGLRKRKFNAKLVYDVTDDSSVTKRNFLPLSTSITFELESLKRLHMNIKPNDVVFVLDPSFPGYIVNLRSWFQGPIVTYCHATSLNNMDIFEPIRSYKWMLEQAFLNECKYIFVATNYHKDKLVHAGIKEENVKVIGFPLPPVLTTYIMNQRSKPVRKEAILLPCRMHKQKINPEVYKELSWLPLEVRWYNNWTDYYDALSSYMVVASLATEETFGIAAAEATFLGTPVLVPNNYAYKELYPEEFKYNSVDDFIAKFEAIISNYDQCSRKASALNVFNVNFLDDIANYLSQL